MSEEDPFSIFAIDLLCSRTNDFLSILNEERATDNLCHLISIYEDTYGNLYALYRNLQRTTEGEKYQKIKQVLLEKLDDGGPDCLVLSCFKYCSGKKSFEWVDLEDIFSRILGIGNNVEAAELSYSILQHVLLYSPDLFIDVLERENEQVKNCVFRILEASDEPFSKEERDLVKYRINTSVNKNKPLKERILVSIASGGVVVE